MAFSAGLIPCSVGVAGPRPGWISQNAAQLAETIGMLLAFIIARRFISRHGLWR